MTNAVTTVLSLIPENVLDVRAPYDPLRRFGGSAAPPVYDRAGGIPDFRSLRSLQAG